MDGPFVAASRCTVWSRQTIGLISKNIFFFHASVIWGGKVNYSYQTFLFGYIFIHTWIAILGWCLCFLWNVWGFFSTSMGGRQIIWCSTKGDPFPLLWKHETSTWNPSLSNSSNIKLSVLICSSFLFLLLKFSDLVFLVLYKIPHRSEE